MLRPWVEVADLSLGIASCSDAGLLAARSAGNLTPRAPRAKSNSSISMIGCADGERGCARDTPSEPDAA
jgi:hypothetical protein